MRKMRFFPAVLALAMVFASCQSGSSPTSPNSGEIVTASGIKLVVSVSRQGTGGLGFLIEIRNEGTSQVSLKFSDSQVFDIAVSNAIGNLVWKWSYDKAFAQLMWQLDLKPGESSSQQGVWDLKANDGSQVPAGIYRVKVWITSYSPDRDVAVEFPIAI